MLCVAAALLFGCFAASELILSRRQHSDACSAGSITVIVWQGRGTHVLIDEVEATVTRHEGGNLLAVFDQLSTHALANGRVGLLRLNATAKAREKGGVRLPEARGAAELSQQQGIGSGVGWQQCAHFLEHNALAVRGAAEGVALELRAQVRLLVRLVRPAVLPAHGPQLAGGVDSTGLSRHGETWR